MMSRRRASEVRPADPRRLRAQPVVTADVASLTRQAFWGDSVCSGLVFPESSPVLGSCPWSHRALPWQGLCRAGGSAVLQTHRKPRYLRAALREWHTDMAPCSVAHAASKQEPSPWG